MRYRYDSRGRARGYAGRPGQQRWRYASRLVKAGYIAGSFVTVLVVVAGLGAYAVYRHLTGNISTVRVTGLSPPRRPARRLGRRGVGGPP